MRASAKYSQIPRHLRSLAEGDWLLSLDGDSVVFHPVVVDALMQGRDLLAVEGPRSDEQPGPAMTNLMLVRNTQANRAMLHRSIVDAGHVVALESERLDEAARLRPVGLLLECNTVLADVYVNVSWRIAQWHDARVFVVNLASPPVSSPGGGWRVARRDPARREPAGLAGTGSQPCPGAPTARVAAAPLPGAR